MLNCPVGPVNWIPNAQPAVDAELSWPVDDQCCDEPELANRPDIVAAAVQALHEASCRRFGVCVLTVRPCVPNCACRQELCVSDCSFRRFDLADFTQHPIISIDAVEIDGVAISPDDYWISGRRWLVPRRGGLLWDCPQQDLNEAAGSVGTWSITMTVGQPPPAMLLIAAADLACQILKLCLDRPCDLPPNAVSVIRDGTTIRLLTGMQSVPLVKMALDVYGDCKKKKIRTRMVHPADVLMHTTSPG